jgi:mono/diheme cytochrome c family protein
MLAERKTFRGVGVVRRFAAVIGAISAAAMAAISAGPVRGQTNIDQGKSASELFANYCVVCHKSTRGLANGRNSLTLSLFLREHYAASSQQAAALAAYVISAGGNAPAAKPERAKSEEPKGQEAKGRETKSPRAALASPKSEPEKPARADQLGPSAPPSSAAAPELPPPTSAASAESQSNDSAPVPRDNIPD